MKILSQIPSILEVHQISRNFVWIFVSPEYQVLTPKKIIGEIFFTNFQEFSKNLSSINTNFFLLEMVANLFLLTKFCQ
jgi:hypothetical protein